VSAGRPRTYSHAGPCHQYRSRGETAVANVLNTYGIPFCYELPRLVYDRGQYRVWHPDFSLPEHGGAVIEYAGMMDLPDYRSGIEHKERAYAANHIPALFVYPEDISRPGWHESIISRVYGARATSGGGASRRSAFQPGRYR
jgi:hypothetical protein